jgi:hypothetical protein
LGVAASEIFSWLGGREIQPTSDGVIWRALRKTEINRDSPLLRLRRQRVDCGETVVGVEGGS